MNLVIAPTPHDLSFHSFLRLPAQPEAELQCRFIVHPSFTVDLGFFVWQWALRAGKHSVARNHLPSNTDDYCPMKGRTRESCHRHHLNVSAKDMTWAKSHTHFLHSWLRDIKQTGEAELTPCSPRIHTSCISASLFAVTRMIYINRVGRKASFWLTVPEGSVCHGSSSMMECLAAGAWANSYSYCTGPRSRVWDPN